MTGGAEKSLGFFSDWARLKLHAPQFDQTCHPPTTRKIPRVLLNLNCKWILVTNLREAVKHYFADFVRKGGTFTDKIRKVVFEILPKRQKLC